MASLLRTCGQMELVGSGVRLVRVVKGLRIMPSKERE